MNLPPEKANKKQLILIYSAKKKKAQNTTIDSVF